MKHLFLDLEDTVIEPVLTGWDFTNTVNTKKVKDFIQGFQPDTVNIFSFALLNDEEKTGFQKSTQKMLQDELGVKFTLVPTMMETIIPACCKVMKLHVKTVTFSDVSEFWSKHEAFRLFARSLSKEWNKPSEVVLLDDAVFNESFHWPDFQVIGQIINVDSI